MSLANIFEAPKLEEKSDVWAFSNNDSHIQIIQEIQSQLGLTLQIRPLDPMPTEGNLEFWLQTHQQSHNDFTSVLNIEGADLTDLNFKDEKAVKAWTFLHANEHRLAAIILGI